MKYALRSLAKSPGFTAIVVLTLALTIGATTAVFSIVRGVLLRAPDYPEPDRIAVLRTAHPPELTDFNASPGDFLSWREHLRSFSALGASAAQSFVLTGTGEPQRLAGARLTADVFQVYGTVPALGRVFRGDEDQPGHDDVVVLSHEFWRQQFGGDPQAVGQRLRLDGRERLIIGVMPPRFLAHERAAVWVPMAFSDEERSEAYRGARFLEVVGRLRPDATLSAAQTELDLVARRLASEYPDFNRGWTVSATSLADYTVRRVRTVLWILLGAVGCVLAVACSNLAGVTLARSLGRTHELAVRASLGATRGRLVRQLLTENLLLAFGGGLAGCLVAAWTIDAILGLAAATALPGEIAIDTSLLVFAAGLSLFVGLLFGLLPAWRLSQVQPGAALKASSASLTAAPHHHRTRRLLAIAQIAIAVALLGCTALLVRSLQRLTATDPGFNVRDAVAAQIDLPASAYDTPTRQQAFAAQLLEHTRALPGVTSAAVTQALPLRGNWNVDFLLEGHPPASDGSQKAGYFAVSPDYFATMGIRLVRGRLFAESDTAAALPVALVNETFARRYFPGGDALGRRIYLMNGPWRLSEIVGIVADVKQTSLAQPAPPQAYEPFAQNPRANLTLVVRVAAGAAGAPAALRPAVFAVDPQQPVTSVLPLESVLAGSLHAQQLVATVLSVFAFIASVIALVGIFGVMMQAVSQRTREFGLRLALGASPGQLLRGVLAQGATLVAAGGLLGLVLTGACLPLIRSLLFHAGAQDAALLGVLLALLGLVALIACYLPARRATQVNPIEALRAE